MITAKLMEPYFTPDICNDSSPQFHHKYTINSTVAGVNEAANRAELVSIDPKLPNLHLYDILRIISKYTVKPKITWWAKSLDLYHRLWVTRSVQGYPNALILGAILCINDKSLDVRVLAFLFGMKLDVLWHVVQRVRNTPAANQPRESFSAQHYLGLTCAFFSVDHKTLATAQEYLEVIEQSVQLLPIGATEPQWLACLSVFFASLPSEALIDAINCAQVAGLSLAKFTDLCDYVWCDMPHMASAYHRQTRWYFELLANTNIVAKLCEDCGVDPETATKSVMLIPQGLFKNGKPFVALALLAALEVSIPESVSSIVLKLANRSPKQLETWKQQVKQYLRG